MASFYYKTYVYKLYSQENSIICFNLKGLFLIACYQQTLRPPVFRLPRDLSRKFR